METNLNAVDIYESIDDDIDEYAEEEEDVSNNTYVGVCSITSFDKEDDLSYLKLPCSVLYDYTPYIHGYVDSYSEIWKNPRLEIIKIYELEDGCRLGILKTFWLRIIQRKWKQLYKEKQNALRKCININALRYREIHGSFQHHIPCHLLNGMLENI